MLKRKGKGRKEVFLTLSPFPLSPFPFSFPLRHFSIIEHHWVQHKLGNFL